MAVAFTRLDGKSGVGTSLVSNSITPGDLTTIFAYVIGEAAGQTVPDPTITGGGLEWHTAANNTFSYLGAITIRHKLAWARTGVSPGSFTVTANFGTAVPAWIILDKAAGAHASAPILHTTFASGASSAGINTGSFAPPLTTGNGTWAGIGWINDALTLTAGSGYTLLTPAVTLLGAAGAQTEWRATAGPTPYADATASAPTGWGITGVEVRAELSLPVRAAFYYPWYTVGGNPGYPGNWTQGFSPYSQYHPKLGYYDSASVAAIDTHIVAMLYGKFSAAISSWWGQGSREDTMFATLLSRSAAAGTGLQWCLYYEAEGNTIAGVTGSPDPTAAQITADLNYLTTHFTSHPNYLRINGKPVIFAFGDAGDGSQAAANLPSARWFAANAAASEDWYYVIKVYGGYTGDAHQPPDWHQYGPASATDQQGTHSYTLSPGFWLATESTPRLARDLASFGVNVRAMLAASVNWKLVTSFNEWGEGHAVEDATGNSGRDYTGNGWETASGYGAYLDMLSYNGIPPSFGGPRVESLARGAGEKLIRSMESLGRTRIERF